MTPAPQGTIVEVEGLKNRRYWTFGVVDRSGLSLIRLSSENQAEASKWVDALVKAGCERRELSADAKERSPLRSADVRWVRGSVPSMTRAGDHQSPVHAHRATTGPSQGLPHAGTAPRRQKGHPASLLTRPRPLWRRGISQRHDVAMHSAPQGYTSDSQTSEASELQERLVQRAASLRPQRSLMIASTPVHGAAKASLLSSERVMHIRHTGRSVSSACHL